MNRRNGTLALWGALALACSLTAAAPARAQATAQRQCMSVDLTGMTIANDCTGDVVTLTSGSMTTCAEAVVDAQGGGHAVVLAADDGFGTSGSGSRYVFQIKVLAVLELPSSGTEVVAVVAPAALIGQGTAPNEDVEILMHVTVDANGTPTATVDRMSARCQG